MKFRDIVPRQKDRPRRGPTLTFKEVALEIGVTERELAGYMGGLVPILPPKPRIVKRHGSVRARYYDAAAVRAWWVEFKRWKEANDAARLVQRSLASKAYYAAKKAAAQ